MAKEDASGSLMSPAEMKPLLMPSKRDPVSVVIGLTKAKDGVVFLAKKVRPRKLLAQTKKRAADAKLELEMTSLRFGWAAVDTAVDSTLVTFTVNKDAAGALRPKLLVHLKKAGFAKCEIVVDPLLETEPDGDELNADGVLPSDGILILLGFRGSPALCVDHSGFAPMLGASGRRVHRTRHERALSHAGLPRRGDHAGRPQPASRCRPRHPARRPMPGLRAREPCRAQPPSPAPG